MSESLIACTWGSRVLNLPFLGYGLEPLEYVKYHWHPEVHTVESQEFRLLDGNGELLIW